MQSNLPTLTLVQSAPAWLVPDASVINADWRAEGVLCILSNALNGTPQKYATTVRLIATATDLWVRFDCADADVWATLTEHDAPLYTEEVVELFIAPGIDTPTHYFELQTNPHNAQFDGIIQNPDEHRSTMTLDLSWDPSWQSWTRVDAAGWVSVWALPWRMFGKNDGIGEWRCNFYRIDRPRNGDAIETSAWSPTLREPVDFHIPSRFGILTITARAQ
jgi:hypothetical protein